MTSTSASIATSLENFALRPPQQFQVTIRILVPPCNPDRLIEDEEEVVDDDAGDGDVEPDGERPAGDGAVARETRAQGEVQSDDDERDDRGSENRVRNENGEINGADSSLP